MPKQSEPKRVAIVVSDLTEGEVETAAGMLDYSQTHRRWRFATGNVRPFARYERIKLDRVDGILGSFWLQNWIDELVERGITAVNTSNRIADAPLPRVGNDDDAIGRMAGEHLINRGFSNVAFMPEPHPSSTSDRRLAGFQHVVDKATGRACPIFDSVDGEEESVTVQRVRQWLWDLPKPVGIFTARDDSAAWIITLSHRAGLRVPQDVAVIGSTNNTWVSACSDVSITSVAPDYRAIGYQAAKLLDQLMSGHPAPPPQKVPPLGIVTRGSTDIIVQDDPLVTDALRYIRQHFADDLTVEQVLDHLGVSRRSLEMRLKKAIGQTPQVAIHTAQIEHAKTMLTASRESMAEIAQACGFSLQPRFNRVFKKLTGMTPSAYRDQRIRRG